MACASTSHVADADRHIDIAKGSQSPTHDPSNNENGEMLRFAAIRAQLKEENMATLVSAIRQDKETLPKTSASTSNTTGCRILPKPLYGSYHIAYRVVFDDGVQWILKIPINGHHAWFDGLASQALTSEAQTMRMIKQMTTVPVPTVHHFDASADNEICCPYVVMDFLEGKPLWQGWFNKEASDSAREQFRARSLQTIAAAMVEISQFALDRGGTLIYDSEGRPVDTAGARVVDWLTEQDVMEGLTTVCEGYPYCEKGPTANPVSSFLFMLQRRGFRDGDGPHQRGIYEIYRLFTEWTLEKAEYSIKNAKGFVLAHPDFGSQNILVEDDGTLCGIIDWDGVATVPLSVGCFKYPDWLMSDWDPWYEYRPGNTTPLENSPEELAAYRVMYAQFVEAFSSIACGSRKVGKSNADITHMSLVAGSLYLGAHELRLTDDAVAIIFKKLEALSEDDDDDDKLDANTDSSTGTNTDGTGEEGSNGDTMPTEVDNSTRDDDEKKSPDGLCYECLPEHVSDQHPWKDICGDLVDMNTKNHSTSFDKPAPLEQGHKAVPLSNGIDAEVLARKQKSYASCKARVADWALGLGQKGAKAIVNSLHTKEDPEVKNLENRKLVARVLGLGEKGCRRASKIFHAERATSGLQSDVMEASRQEADSRPVMDEGTMAIDLCKRVEKLLRKVTARMHRESIIDKEGLGSKQTKSGPVKIFVKWTIALLKILLQKIVKVSTNGLQPPDAADNRSRAKDVLLETKHSEICNSRKEGSGWGKPDDDNRPADVNSRIIWVSKEVNEPQLTSNEVKDLICPGSTNIILRDFELNIAVSGSTNLHYDINGLPGPKSLFSQPEAAKRQFHMRMALEAESSEPAIPEPEISRAVVAQTEDIRIQKPECDVAAADAMKEANHPGERPLVIKAGRWFETSTGGLKRMENEEPFHDGLHGEEPIVQVPDIGFPINVQQSPKYLVADEQQESPTKVPDSQLQLPSPKDNEGTNSFQVPDIDEDEDEHEDLENNEIREQALGQVDVISGNGEGKESSGQKANEGEVVDMGHFSIGQICVALGNGHLDERRMARMKRGFMALLDDTVGRCRR